jgi:hypothetical protein
MKTPTYRATRQELVDEKQKALEWFAQQCRNVVHAWNDPAARSYAFAQIDECVSGGTGYVKLIDNPDVTSTTGYRPYNVSCHVWRAGASLRSSHGSERFVLRKDGTIDTERLSEALRLWVDNEIARDRRKETSAASQTAVTAAIATLEVPRWLNVRPSYSDVAFCVVSTNRSASFKLREEAVRIVELGVFIHEMTVAHDAVERALNLGRKS